MSVLNKRSLVDKTWRDTQAMTRLTRGFILFLTLSSNSRGRKN